MKLDDYNPMIDGGTDQDDPPNPPTNPPGDGDGDDSN